MSWVWTGPREDDWADSARVRLRRPVPPSRWPYGPPSAHESCCTLHGGGLFCDCKASASDEESLDWGAGA